MIEIKHVKSSANSICPKISVPVVSPAYEQTVVLIAPQLVEHARVHHPPHRNVHVVRAQPLQEPHHLAAPALTGFFVCNMLLHTY